MHRVLGFLLGKKGPPCEPALSKTLRSGTCVSEPLRNTALAQ